jgi:hypothetical protein
MDTVRFAFRLPPVLLLRAPIGLWPRAPRGVTVRVESDGAVDVICTSGSELHARGMAIATAASFLHAVDHNVPPTTIPASLTVPSCGDREIRYAIRLGVRVSIARTGEAPAVFGNPLLAVAG